MACFSKESGSWGDCCVAVLGTACLLAAILASVFTVAQWQQDRAAYRWTRCLVGHVENTSWLECPLQLSDSNTGGLGHTESSSDGGQQGNYSFPCLRVMVRYQDESGEHKMGILHPDVSSLTLQENRAKRCSIVPCVGSTTLNIAAVYHFASKWQDFYEHFACYVSTAHPGEVVVVRPHTSRALELLVLFAVVVFVVCVLTISVRCRCVYLNAREARSCAPSARFFITTSARSLKALLWTLAYKLFDWKLQSSQSQTLSSHDTQGLVEQYREDREDADPCLPAAALPRSPSVGYSQPRPSNSQTYTPLTCPPSDIRL